MEKPSIRPNNPNFSSGPCSKRPGWTIEALKDSPIGRSHRHKVCKEKLNEAIVKSKKILELPDDYQVGVCTWSKFVIQLECDIVWMIGVKDFTISNR